MAREVRAFRVTIPVGGTAAAPQRFPLTLPVRVVPKVDLRIPPGPSGQVGVALAVSGVQMIPHQDGTYIVGDDDRITYDLDDFPTSGPWSLLAYNVGVFAHTVELTFHLDLVAPGAPPLPVPIDPSLLAGVIA